MGARSNYHLPGYQPYLFTTRSAPYTAFHFKYSSFECQNKGRLTVITPLARHRSTCILRCNSALRYQRDAAQLRCTLVGGPGLWMQLQHAGINILFQLPAWFPSILKWISRRPRCGKPDLHYNSDTILTGIRTPPDRGPTARLAITTLLPTLLSGQTTHHFTPDTTR